ncbi:MAG TPA: acyclic terpene utilization AtuA family protein, partial [Acidimicrobiia bacterium]|nr:acyclic terpene utilization AtuA family protein [Acidimicrobiia bacterium]
MEYVSFFVGAGFADESMAAAAAHDLAFIGADAGTIDVGPYQLAGVGTIFPENLCRHDLRRALITARHKGIPLIVGSCGGSGSDASVDWFAHLVRDIAADEGLSPFRLATIYSEVDRELLKQRIRAGRLHPLAGAPPTYGEDDVDRSHRIVGVMGAEPIMAALETGADVVLSGRTTDSAIFSALPELRGVPAGVAWHAAKVAECGGAIADPPKADLLHVVLDTDAFTVAPLNPALHCTPWSVAAHQLYENADPFIFVEPGGTLDASAASFEAVDPATVRISGGAFTRRDRYTMKLEGVELAGYQSVAMMSYTDRVLLETLPTWLEEARREVDVKVRRVFGDRADTARLTVRPYGAGAGTPVFPTSPAVPPAAEVFLLLDVVAPDQATATGVAAISWHTLCHFPTKGWSGVGITTAAWPYNPPVIDRGPVYRFNVNHAMELDDPLEATRTV